MKQRLINQSLTTKQAKAAYKARQDPSNLTDLEKRRLQRGAELLVRADKYKDQDKRKKPAVLKPPRNAQSLSTQRVVGRWGHKSSQSHLGNFVKKITLPEDDDETLVAKQVCEHDQVMGDGVEQDVEHQTSPTMQGLEGLWDSSTQIAREIALQSPNIKSGGPAAPPMRSRTFQKNISFASFDSDDMFSDWAEVERLDVATEHAMTARRLMPPPQQVPQTSSKRPTPDSRRMWRPSAKTPSLAMADSGISMQDLEEVAASDLVFTQA